MPNFRRWIGGATAVAQVRTTEITGAAAGSTITTTLTAEDGSTQSVVTTMTSSTLADQATVYRNSLAASSQSEFQKLTYSVDGAVVTITASIAGRPFNMSISATSGSASASNASPTASAGPNDFNTAANWSGGTKPASDDLVSFSSGSFDLLYGLDQSAIVLYQFSVSEGFSGNIGTSTTALRIQTDAGNSAAENTLNLAGSGFMYNFSGDFPIVNVSANRSTLKVTGEISETNFVGPAISGSITLDSADATTNGNDITISNVSPACRIIIPNTATNTGDIRMDSGLVECSAVTKSAKSSLLMSGGTFVTKGSGQIAMAARSLGASSASIMLLGGTYRHESDAALSGSSKTLAVYGGTADFSKVAASTSAEFIDLGDVLLFGGIIDKTAAGNLTKFSSLTKAGGDVLQPAHADADGSGSGKR